MAILIPGCAAHTAATDTRGSKSEPSAALLAWLASHEPSRLVVSGFSVEAVRRSDPGAFIRNVSEAPPAACREALRDHALLLIFAPVGQPERRSSALDCGFALWRDDGAVVVAPR